MRTKYFFIAAVAATVLASCSSNDFVGDQGPNEVSQNNSGAINFGGGFKAVTRANHVGADAASLLGNKFIVGGFKMASDAVATTTVFDNYQVIWGANTAGTTESNTSDWEYVGKDKYLTSGITGSQTIKYWDYSQNLYDFVAYSTGNKTAVSTEPGSGEVKVSAFNTTDHSFTLKGAEADLTACYVADRVTVQKADFGKEVTLSFRNLAAKVRVALYETIPGYSVTNVYFYENNTDEIDTDVSSNTNATLIGTFNTGGTYTVTYPNHTVGNSDYNKAHVTLSDPSTEAVRNTFGTLNYTNGEGALSSSSTYLQRTSTTPSFAGSGTYYQTVLPNEDGAVMELRINYTLVPNDGAAETITIHGAKAYVPVQFTKWLPNYAYTYIFKISDNSNGWTSTTTTDPAGLYPITFDAVVVDSEDNTQSTITNVASPSITTYQKGHNHSTDGPEYEPDDIYVQVMLDGTLKNDLGSKGQLYTLSSGTWTEADVLDALNIQSTSTETTITGRNTLVLTKASSDATITTIPGEDGNNIDITGGQAAKFAATANTYAYVYDTDTWDGIAVALTAEPTGWPTGYYTDKACTTAATTYSDGTYYMQSGYIYSAETMTSSTPSDWSTSGVWWKDPNGIEAAGTWDASNEGKVFYKRYTANAKIYGVKVIKVQ